MTLRPEYSLGHSAYNPFLFASVGIEQHSPGTGVDELTVLSALTRLQLDPWQEAARLADLPDDLASRSLAETLARLPGLNWHGADAVRAAQRLVALLPADAVPAIPLTPEVSAGRRETTEMPDAVVQKPSHPVWLVWVALAAAALTITLCVQPDNNLKTSESPSRTVQQ